MTKVVSALTMQSGQTMHPLQHHPGALNIKGPQVLLAALGHPNWHMVPMGHCCLV